MEILKRKGFVQKIIITLIVLILFNFVMPKSSMAWGNDGGSLASPITSFVCWVGDEIIKFLQQIFLDYQIDVSDKKRSIDILKEQAEERHSELQTKILNGSANEQELDEYAELEEKLKDYDILYEYKNAWTRQEASGITGADAAAGFVLEQKLDEEYPYIKEKYPECRHLFDFQEEITIIYGPLTIFSNVIPALDVNFINPQISFAGIKNVNYSVNVFGDLVVDSYEVVDSGNVNNVDNIANALQRTIATWYNALRNLAIVFLLSVLIYIAIRIILSSAAGETAKYKSMLKDWLIALCILFFMHYFMAFLLKSTEMVTQFLTTNSGSGVIDTYMSNIRSKIPSEGDITSRLAETVMYFTLVCYTLMFTWRYLKRVVYLAFLTMISPLVAFTYPIDKIKDGSAQAFNKWFKEYLFNLLIQPVHLLLYTILVTSAIDLAKWSMLYSLVALGFMLEAEKIVKDFFGLSAQRGESTGAAITGGAMFAATVGLVQKGLGFLPEGDSGKGEKRKPRHSSLEGDSAAKGRVKTAWIDNNGDTQTGNQNGEGQGGTATVGTQTGEAGNRGTAGIQYIDLRNRASRAREFGNQGISSENSVSNVIDTSNFNYKFDNIGYDTIQRTENRGGITYSMNDNGDVSSVAYSMDSNSTNISGGNVPGSIQNATIQNAIIQNATMSQGANIQAQGANLQGQSSSRVAQAGGVQTRGTQTGGTTASTSQVNERNTMDNTDSTNNKSSTDEQQQGKGKPPSEFERIKRGLGFVVSEKFSKDNRRKFGKKALRLGLMGAGAAALGTMGLGAGLAGNGTDDVVKYTGMGLGLGAIAGRKGYGLIQEGYQGSKDRNETFKEGYWGSDYHDKYYTPKLNKEYTEDPEVIKHYKMYYGNDWKASMKKGVELRNMGIKDQDDIDIGLTRVLANYPKLTLPQVASIMQFYKDYTKKDLEERKYQLNVYRQALEMAGGNKQKAAEIVTAVMKSRKVTKTFEPPTEEELNKNV